MEEEKKQKRVSPKRRHLGDFTPNPQGGYVYTGAYVTSPLPGQEYKARLRRLVFLGCLWAAAALAAGWAPDTGMEGNALLLLPYAGGLLIALRVVWLLVRLCRRGQKLPQYIYEKTLFPLRQLTAFGLALGILSLGFFLYSLATGKLAGTFGGHGIYAANALWQAITCLLIHLRLSGLGWAEEGSAP